MTEGPRVLVVDDEESIRLAIERSLAAHGFCVTTAADGASALSAFAGTSPEVVILDLGLPDMDGTAVIRDIRRRSSTPIIVVSVRGLEREKVTALDLGADDFITKPFGIEEMLARVRAALRRANPGPQPTGPFRTGELEVDIDRRMVRVNSKEVHLTPTEYNLLLAFVARPDRVLTDHALLAAVWGPGYGDESHYLHVYMARLRSKIEPDPRHPRYLLTEPGVGYRLVSGQ
jgi:two-component system KDP operon response regulator KdpE